MRNYIARWYDVSCGKEHIRDIEAEDLPAAKHKAFQIFCDNNGSRLIDNVEVYEHRYTFQCKGESNPCPNSGSTEFAQRDYYTGMKIRRRGKDNG